MGEVCVCVYEWRENISKEGKIAHHSWNQWLPPQGASDELTGLRKIYADVSTASQPQAPPKASLSQKGQSEEHRVHSPVEAPAHVNVLPAPGYPEHNQEWQFKVMSLAEESCRAEKQQACPSSWNTAENKYSAQACVGGMLWSLIVRWPYLITVTNNVF